MAEQNVSIAQRNVYQPQGDFRPMGDQLELYWSRYATNFPKLAKVASILRHWPTSSTNIERSFSLIAARYSKRGNRVLAETLESLHNSSRESRAFIAALKNTCDELGISYE